MKYIFKKRIAFLSTMWLMLTHMFWVPSNAYAVAVADGIKCEEIPNDYWTPRVAKAYARALMDMQYSWNSSEYKHSTRVQILTLVNMPVVYLRY